MNQPSPTSSESPMAKLMVIYSNPDWIGLQQDLCWVMHEDFWFALRRESFEKITGRKATPHEEESWAPHPDDKFMDIPIRISNTEQPYLTAIDKHSTQYISLKRRNLQEQIRYLAQRLDEGESKLSVALSLRVIADEIDQQQSPEYQAELQRLRENFIRESSKGKVDILMSMEEPGAYGIPRQLPPNEQTPVRHTTHAAQDPEEKPDTRPSCGPHCGTEHGNERHCPQCHMGWPIGDDYGHYAPGTEGTGVTNV